MRTVEYLEQELKHWPAVAYEIVDRGRHKAALVSYGGETRKIYFSGTVVDRRSVLNNLSAARKVLRGMGAQREERI